MDRSSTNESAGADERSATPSRSSSGATDASRQAVGQARDTVRQELRSARDDVQRRAADTVNRQKHRVADRLDAIVHALHAAHESLREDEQPQLARYVDDLTTQVERSTGYLRNNDFGGMMHDMEDLARNNTGVFLGSTFVAGLALGRFLRSSEPDQPGGELQGDWRGEMQSRGAGAGGTGAYGTGVTGGGSALGAAAYGTSHAADAGTTDSYRGRGTSGFQTNAFGSYADRGMHASGAAQGGQAPDESRRTGQDRDLDFEREAGEPRGRDHDHGADATRRAAERDRATAPGTSQRGTAAPGTSQQGTSERGTSERGSDAARRAASDENTGTTGGTAFERDTDATRGTQSDRGTERTRETWGEDR